MAGPRLELFRFGLYVFFPIYIMYHVGDPEFYRQYINPLRDAYLQPEKAEVKLSQTESELQTQLAQLKEQRLAKRERRLQHEQPAAATESERLV